MRWLGRKVGSKGRRTSKERQKKGGKQMGGMKRGMQAVTGREEDWKMFSLDIHTKCPMSVLLLTIFVNNLYLAGPGRTWKMSLKRWLIGSSLVIH